uniref:Olfactory receptor n=1 Tax=Leptobrachium leishanense TaxID=445787 RepID=A0A8C5M9E4_9ANUR
MPTENKSKNSEFTVQGLSDLPQLQLPLFVLFLVVYISIVLSNFTVFTCIILDSHLHSPMYIFLCHLSLLDISYTSTIVPKLLAMIFTQRNTMSFIECMIQLYFFMSFVAIEFLLLTAMAYDRFVAICHPLRYSSFMNQTRCVQLVLAVWVGGFSESVTHTVLISNLTYCSSRRIDHFFCDVPPLLKLSCSDTYKVEISTFIIGTLMDFSSLIFTFLSYIFIITAILKIQSADGRQKAFSTCSSHITCVTIFYGMITCIYMRPASMYSPGQDKFFALLYVILLPMLNPLIYTLLNKDFKDAIKRIGIRHILAS